MNKIKKQYLPVILVGIVFLGIQSCAGSKCDCPKVGLDENVNTEVPA